MKINTIVHSIGSAASFTHYSSRPFDFIQQFQLVGQNPLDLSKTHPAHAPATCTTENRIKSCCKDISPGPSTASSALRRDAAIYQHGLLEQLWLSLLLVSIEIYRYCLLVRHCAWLLSLINESWVAIECHTWFMNGWHRWCRSLSQTKATKNAGYLWLLMMMNKWS